MYVYIKKSYTYIYKYIYVKKEKIIYTCIHIDHKHIMHTHYRQTRSKPGTISIYTYIHKCIYIYYINIYTYIYTNTYYCVLSAASLCTLHFSCFVLLFSSRLARQHMPHQLHQSLTCTAVHTTARSCYGGVFA